MGRSNGFLAAAATVVVFASATPARAVPYQSLLHRFSLELPPGWEAISTTEMKGENEAANRLMPGMQVNLLAGFRRTKRDVGSSFIWLQHDPRVTAATTFDELQQELTRDFAAARRREPEALLRLTRRLLVPNHQPEFDPVRQRFTVRGVMGGERGQARTYTAGYLRADGLYILHAMTRDGGSEAELAPLVSACDSFRFEEPEKPAALMDRVFGDKVGPEGRMAIVGAVIAILIAGVGSLFMREKPARRWRY